jgi:hypothetical protein
MLRPGAQPCAPGRKLCSVTMRTNRAIALLSTVLIAAGCHTLDISGQSSNNTCPTSAVITAGAGVTDFRQRIPRQTAVAPPDSILDVVISFVSAVSQADRDRIATYNGTNVANAGSATTLRAEFEANDLASYVVNDTGRLTDVVIYIPDCVNR